MYYATQAIHILAKVPRSGFDSRKASGHGPSPARNEGLPGALNSLHYDRIHPHSQLIRDNSQDECPSSTTWEDDNRPDKLSTQPRHQLHPCPMPPSENEVIIGAPCHYRKLRHAQLPLEPSSGVLGTQLTGQPGLRTGESRIPEWTEFSSISTMIYNFDWCIIKPGPIRKDRSKFLPILPHIVHPGSLTSPRKDASI